MNRLFFASPRKAKYQSGSPRAKAQNTRAVGTRGRFAGLAYGLAALAFLVLFTIAVQLWAPSALTDCAGPGDPCYPSQ